MYVALNISSQKIKILSLKGKSVKTWASADLPAGLVRDGMIMQPQAVGEAINSLFKSTGTSKSNVIVSVAGLSFTYRFISLPRMKRSLLEEAILRAAKKEISLPLDELYVSWQTIHSNGNEQEYFIIGVPRSQVDAAVQTLKIAGIDPYLMDLRPLALARTANRSDAIVVSMEPDCFDIVFITHGLPTVIHTISPRSEGAHLEDNIHRLADELTKTAAFYQSNHPDTKLNESTPLLLTGELAAEVAVGGMLQSEIEYPIERLIPPVEFPDSLPISSYATSIGLATKRTAIKPPPRGDNSYFSDINVNILEGKYRRPKAKPIALKSLLLSTFLVAAVGLVYPLYQANARVTTENKVLEAELVNIEHEINLANLVNEETMITQDMLYQLILDTEALEEANTSILSSRGIFNTELQQVTGAIPLKTSFTSIEIQKDIITIQGETEDVFSVIKYAAALEAAGIFTSVRISELDETLITPSGTGEDGMPPPMVNAVTFEIVAKLTM
jgi:Tfp pilus assembly PilM family ATPase/Tfp pilus assembly protein PilN